MVKNWVLSLNWFQFKPGGQNWRFAFFFCLKRFAKNLVREIIEARLHVEKQSQQSLSLCPLALAITKKKTKARRVRRQSQRKIWRWRPSLIFKGQFWSYISFEFEKEKKIKSNQIRDWRLKKTIRGTVGTNFCSSGSACLLILWWCAWVKARVSVYKIVYRRIAG